MKQTIKCLAAVFAAMLMSVAAFAQVTTSALGGRVVDASGQPVIGAAVVATHVPSGTVYGRLLDVSCWTPGRLWSESRVPLTSTKRISSG